MNKTQQKVIIGKFGSVHGVHGWIRVYSFTEPKENLLNYPNWQVLHQKHWQNLEIKHIKAHDDHFLVKLPNCDDRDLARRYTNNLIAINHEELPELPPQEYYWSDLIGMKVVTITGILLGQIDDIFETGSNDVFVVQNDKKRLIPYTDHVVQSINLKDNIMLVDWDPEF